MHVSLVQRQKRTGSTLTSWLDMVSNCTTLVSQGIDEESQFKGVKLCPHHRPKIEIEIQVQNAPMSVGQYEVMVRLAISMLPHLPNSEASETFINANGLARFNQPGNFMLGAWFPDVMANWCRSSWLGLRSFMPSPTDKVNDELCGDGGPGMNQSRLKRGTTDFGVCTKDRTTAHTCIMAYHMDLPVGECGMLMEETRCRECGAPC
jgi:hypothetical protein